ncbi:MAG: hypothetical protein GY849_07985 [Deltaproteobacteria bacterium]|nr:hypothetical protein [Deltaproteobacteria bacterium]
MKAIELIEEIGELLGEDFTYSPLWSKDELLSDLIVVVRMFGELTLLVDRCRVCLLDYTTGEITLPDDFGQLFFGQYSQEFLDIVDLNETEFLNEAWLADGTGSPQGITVWGSGDNVKARVIPVPTTIEVPGGGGTGVDSVLIDDGGSIWTVTCSEGVLISTLAGVTASAVQVIYGFGSYWDLGINTSGVLTLTASSSTTDSNLVLTDIAGDGREWAISAGLGGVLETDLGQWGPGLCTGIIVSESGVDTYQTGNSDYGILVDLYADGVSVSPEHVGKMSEDYGFVQYGDQYLGEGTMWYKGLPRRVDSLYSEVVISKGLLPVIKHGVLARAFSKDGDGQDLEKSNLLGKVFLSECESLKNTFGKRW